MFEFSDETREEILRIVRLYRDEPSDHPRDNDALIEAIEQTVKLQLTPEGPPRIGPFAIIVSKDMPENQLWVEQNGKVVFKILTDNTDEPTALRTKNDPTL